MTTFFQNEHFKTKTLIFVLFAISSKFKMMGCYGKFRKYIFQSFTADSLRLSACCWVMLPCNAPTAGARPGLHSHNSVLVSLCLGSDIETPLLLLWCNYQFYIQRGQSLFSVCQTITSGCRVLETCHFSLWRILLCL